MADLLSNEEMLEEYFASDSNESEFEGFDVQSDVDVPNALNSSDQEDETSENGDGIEDDWTSQLREIRVQNFTEETGPNFPDGYDCNTATPMDYFNLMYSTNIIPDFVRHTSSYARWKMEQSETDDPIWYEVAEILDNTLEWRN